MNKTGTHEISQNAKPVNDGVFFGNQPGLNQQPPHPPQGEQISETGEQLDTMVDTTS